MERWTKKVNLFEKDFIVVPINEHAHWFVCVICFPGQLGCVDADTGEACDPPASQSRARGARGQAKRKTVKKPMTIGSTTITRVIPGRDGRDDIKFLDDDGSDRDEAEASDDELEDEEEDAGQKKAEEAVAAKLAIKQPCILTFDSLAGSSKARTHQTLREYLTCEWKKKMVSRGNEERVFTKDSMPATIPKVQQQPNFSDCGIYLLQYVESFFRDPIRDYSLPIPKTTLMPQWFPKNEVEGKRDNIASLIRELAASQNPGKEFKFPQLNFFNPPDEESEEDEDEEFEDSGRGSRPPYVQISSGQPVRVTSGGPVVMTPSKGQVLIQKTGNQFKVTIKHQHFVTIILITFYFRQMSPYNKGVVPAGVTVTPAPGPPIRQLAANNISVSRMGFSWNNNPNVSSPQIRKMVPAGDAVQTSPDSTSQEDSLEAGSGGGGGGHHDNGEAELRPGDAAETVRRTPGPDSVSQGAGEAVNGVKRTAVEVNGCDNGVKRIKSDTES